MDPRAHRSASSSPPSPIEAAREGDWCPNPGPQTRFLATAADECLYGGAAGGGKSSALVALPLRWVEQSSFRALILRRETTQLVDLLDKARDLYPRIFPGARANNTTHTWSFPSGATVRFNHCQHEDDAASYDGHEYQLVEFDELTHFTEKQYRAIRARIRSSKPGLPRYTRSTTNPGGAGHEWVFRRWAPWLDPEYSAPELTPRRGEDGQLLPPAAPGEVLWYAIDDAGREAWVPRGTPEARSRTFIPARLSDNPRLLEHDPSYAQALRDLDPVRRAQLLDGNWLIKPAAGLYFKRAWFKPVEAVPSLGEVVRYWDRAATPDGDWTVGLKMLRAREDGLFYILDVVRMRGRPHEVRQTIRTTAVLDGVATMVAIEEDPGQAGKVEAADYVQLLAGFNVRTFPVRHDKIVRAQPASAQAEAGNFRMRRGLWNEAFVQELEQFPDEGNYDDQVDALSGAFNVLTAFGGLVPPKASGDRPIASRGTGGF